MLPSYFHRIFNFNGKILTYRKRNDEYPYLKKYCKGLKLEFIKKSNRFSKICEKNVVKYLFFNAKKIDILNLIHPHEDNIIYGVVYKLFNKNGFIYLKMDVNEAFKKRLKYRCSHIMARTQNNGIRSFLSFIIKKKIYLKFLDIIDLISFESKESVEYFKTKYPKYREKIIYVPNGIDDISIKEAGLQRISFKEKENIILTVGRIGAEIKSNETLLNAIADIKNLKNWKIILIGPIEKKFKKYLFKFFKENPNLKDRIYFIGEITDREKLFEYYQKSKIFCLTSKNESFGIVLVEAAYFGNYIVCSNFPAARDITLNGDIGSLFSPGNSKELAKILQDLINNEKRMEDNYLTIQEFTKKNYSWSMIVQNLYKNILERK